MYPRLPDKILAAAYGANTPRGPNAAYRNVEGYNESYADLAPVPEGNVESANDYWAVNAPNAQLARPGTSMGNYGKDAQGHWRQCQDAYLPPTMRPGSAPVRLGAGTPPMGGKHTLFPRNLLQIVLCVAPEPAASSRYMAVTWRLHGGYRARSPHLVALPVASDPPRPRPVSAAI